MSRRTSRRALAAVFALLLGCLVAAGQASADPSGAFYARDIIAVCDDGSSVVMVANGGGWHSAHVVDGTAVFVPLSVEDSGTFYDAAGGAHPFVHPLDVKGNARPNGHAIVTCAFSVDTTFPDNSRLVANGTLIGFFT